VSDSTSTLPSDHNTEELTVMARMLRRSNGQFALAFARCNSPVQRASLVAILRDSLAALNIPIAEVTLSGPEADIPAELAAGAVPNPGAPLFVYGLESLMPSDLLRDKPSQAQYRALAQLNERRGRYQTLARPLVFWVPEYALRLIAEVAGDFWAWRSGVFEFVAGKEAVRETYQREMALPYVGESNLTRAEKEVRIRVLTALLDDYEGNDAETRAARSNVLYRLGQMQAALGQYEQARRLYEASLKIDKELGDRRGVAVTQGSLAYLHRLRGDYDQAEALYRASLKTMEELGDRREVAVTQGSLAYLHRLRGDYDQAEALYRASLKTKEELGDRREVAVTLHNLALLRVQQARLTEALELLARSRDLLREIGLEKDATRVEETIREIQGRLSEAKVP